MTKPATLYHNPRCSKSRAALQYLQQQELEFVTVNYLDTPPPKDTLLELLQALNLSPRQLMRQGEARYRELQLADNSLTEDQLINAMIDHPVLIERPIVHYGDQAAIGRPLENIIDLLDD